MEYLKSIGEYLGLIESNSELDIQNTDLIKINKYNNINELIESTDKLLEKDPPSIYKENGIVDIPKARIYYGNTMKKYYNYQAENINISNPYNKFFILHEEKVVLDF